MSKSRKTEQEHTLRICGTWSIWSKGQIVIPKEVREILGMESWDSVSFLLKDEKFLWIVPNNSIDLIMQYIESEKNVSLIK